MKISFFFESYTRHTHTHPLGESNVQIKGCFVILIILLLHKRLCSCVCMCRSMATFHLCDMRLIIELFLLLLSWCVYISWLHHTECHISTHKKVDIIRMTKSGKNVFYDVYLKFLFNTFFRYTFLCATKTLISRLCTTDYKWKVLLLCCLCLWVRISCTYA